MTYLAHSDSKGRGPQTYAAHVSDVVALANRFADRASRYSSRFKGLFEIAVDWAAAYHDLGKLDEANQRALGSRTSAHLPINHVDAGVARLLQEPPPLGALAALLVFSHHRGLPGLYEELTKPGGWAFRDGASLPGGMPLKEHTDRMLADYLVRHDEVLQTSQRTPWPGLALRGQTSLFYRLLLSCLVDADHSNTAKHVAGVEVEESVPLRAGDRLACLNRFVREVANRATGDPERNALRGQVYQACLRAQGHSSGMVACDSPVGTGKTTAVMAHLLGVAEEKGLRHIFVVLPFTNIIDQSVEIYRKALVLPGERPESVVAAHHHRADFEDLSSRSYATLWRAPITVTTAVQFFETLASARTAPLRKMHELPGSAVFLDESHAALPAHLWPSAWRWLQEMAAEWGCYFVFASGSLAPFWELEEFSCHSCRLAHLLPPDLRSSGSQGEGRRLTYHRKREPMDLEDLTSWLSTLPGPRLIIFNTVQSAAVVARRLAEVHGRGNVEHLSTSLAPVHRARTLRRVKRRLRNSADCDWSLVATSCVEAGVDLSFRSGARESCSLVSLVQTGGRVNREAESGGAQIWDFRLAYGNALREHPAFKVSAAVLSKLFEEGKVSETHCLEAMTREIREKNLGLANADLIVNADRRADFPSVADQFRVIDSDTCTVLILPSLAREIEANRSVDPQRLVRGSVQIWRKNLERFAVREIHGVRELYAWTLPYDGFLGYMAGVMPLLSGAGTLVV